MTFQFKPKSGQENVTPNAELLGLVQSFTSRAEGGAEVGTIKITAQSQGIWVDMWPRGSTQNVGFKDTAATGVDLSRKVTELGLARGSTYTFEAV